MYIDERAGEDQVECGQVDLCVTFDAPSSAGVLDSPLHRRCAMAAIGIGPVARDGLSKLLMPGMGKAGIFGALSECVAASW